MYSLLAGMLSPPGRPVIELKVDPAEIAASLPPGQRRMLERFERLLATEAAPRGHVARSSAPESWRVHVLDSLAGVALLDAVLTDPAAARIVDVGSGAGLPGIVLAIARPHWQLTLLDSRRGRIRLLGQFIDSLGLANVAACKGDAAAVDGGFGAAVARALAPPPDSLALCRRLVAADGPVGLYLTDAQLSDWSAGSGPAPIGLARYRLSGMRSGRVVAAFAADSPAA